MNDPVDPLPVPLIQPDLSAQIRAALAHVQNTPAPVWQADPVFGKVLEDLGRQINETLIQPVVQAFRRIAKQVAEAIKAFLTFRNPPKRRRPRRRNTRVQMVQAKRKRLFLDQDGKCCGLRSRKASYALRLEEERFLAGLRADLPRLCDFEHVPARRRRKEARRHLKWKPIQLSDKDLLCAGGFIPQSTWWGKDSGPELVWPAADWFPGTISEVSLSKRSLSPSDIHALFNTPPEKAE